MLNLFGQWDADLLNMQLRRADYCSQQTVRSFTLSMYNKYLCVKVLK